MSPLVRPCEVHSSVSAVALPAVSGVESRLQPGAQIVPKAFSRLQCEIAPTNCAAMKAGTSAGRMPANVMTVSVQSLWPDWRTRSGRKPVRPDQAATIRGHHRAAVTEDYKQESECSNAFSKPLSRAGTDVRRHLQQR